MQTESLKNLAMDGKIAVVTGSTQGLGEAVATLFADRGAAGIVITGRDAARGAKVRAALEAKGTKAVFVPASLDKVEDVHAIMAACEKSFGRIDALVNAAGNTDRGSIWETTPETFDRIFAINSRGPFFLMQDALKLMRKNKTQGTIVNILSISGRGGQSFITAYCGSKAALEVMTKNVAASVMSYRIRVNGLNIGWMDSPGEHATMTKVHNAPVDWLAGAEATKPFGRLIKPAEVARAVAFLSSEESGLMTGAVIDFDQQVVGAGDSHPDLPKAQW